MARRNELTRSLVTSHAAETIFAALCDLRAAPSWLPNCTALEPVEDGPLVAGAHLRYGFREHGYTGTLACTLSAFVPGQRIAIAFADTRVEASFDFVLEPQGSTTAIHHTVEFVPRSFAVRLLAGVIRRGLPARMDAALHGLVRVAGAAPSDPSGSIAPAS